MSVQTCLTRWSRRKFTPKPKILVDDRGLQPKSSSRASNCGHVSGLVLSCLFKKKLRQVALISRDSKFVWHFMSSCPCQANFEDTLNIYYSYLPLLPFTSCDMFIISLCITFVTVLYRLSFCCPPCLHFNSILLFLFLLRGFQQCHSTCALICLHVLNNTSTIWWLQKPNNDQLITF